MTNDETAPPLETGGNEEIPFEEFEAEGTTLAEFFRNNPLAKVGLVAGVFVLVVGGLLLFGGGSKQAPVSMVKGGNNVSEAPGTAEVNPAYQNQLKEANAKAAQEAIQQNKSVVPIPISPLKNPPELTQAPAQQEDPLERWRRIQEESAQKQQTAAGPGANLAKPNPNAQAIKDLSNAMSTQMESVLNSLKIAKIGHAEIAPADYIEKEEEEKQKAAANATQSGTQQYQQGQSQTGQQTKAVDILVPAGTIEYAQLITEADSNVNGPILAQISSGPLAGSRLLGSFSTQGAGDQDAGFLVLNFNMVVVNGISYPVSAVAIDPSTASPGMVTDIDHRYLERIILPAAAAFIQGMGSAIANTGSTTTTSSSSTQTSTPPLNAKQQLFAGIATAAASASQVISQQGQQAKPIIRVAAGTTMGILFTQPVTQQRSQ